jgi:hypothetical protein
MILSPFLAPEGRRELEQCVRRQPADHGIFRHKQLEEKESDFFKKMGCKFKKLIK